ncbi:hypothetical protein QWJ06_08145 [Kocuria rhizophila]|uniref:hypothetical protein n=1 Tax=Kocuria rhizophila TaxID=72000 RepID=UPI001392FA63|nr:hypothetical protein [Kocuria rhizophila]MBO4146008.1 hypothetical protein [Kocuria rhizophila]MDN3226686.1 hypothetical protein [Kocuria rhizophila]MXN61513.1 hypothetical protein [Bacillus sp. BGMRC0062]QTK30769.1 hypothetical protein J5U48_06985 [Kocuria rhizophila]
MTFLLNLLLFLHIVGVAVIVGTWIYTMKRPTVTSGQFWAAVLMLITGLGLVGIREMDGGSINYAKITVKIVILLVVLVASFIGMRKTQRNEPVSTGLAHAVGGMALINAAVAVFW